MVNRSRSRSKSRDREKGKKDREREKRDKDRDRHRHRRSRSRSKSPKSSRRERSRSSSPHHRSSKKDRRGDSPITDYLTLGNVKPKTSASHIIDTPVIIDPKNLEGKTEEEIEMMKVMGFAGFETTKGKHVDGSANASAANIQQKRRYRQYMNRKGGFNRPLDPVA